MMKHQVFLSESEHLDKFSKFTEKFDRFSATTISKDSHLKKEQPKMGSEVADLLNDLALITVKPSQFSGQFLFSFSNRPEKKFQLVWCSFGALMALIRTTTFILQVYYFNIFADNITKRFGVDYGENSTLGVTEIILSVTIFLSDFVASFLFWKERTHILSFLNTLTETLALFAEDIKGAPWIQEWFRQTMKKTRRMVRIIYFCPVITTVIMEYRDIYEIFLCLQGKYDGEMDLFAWTFPVFATAWFIVLFTRLHFRVLLMSVIDGLQFGFQTVKYHVQQFDQENEEGIAILGNHRFLKSYSRHLNGCDLEDHVISKDSTKKRANNTAKDYLREVKLTQILEKYRTMEKLLHEYNELFAPHLLIGIVSIVVVMLMALFHFFVDVNYKLSETSTIFAIEALVYTLVLFSMGTAATDMASEVCSND